MAQRITTRVIMGDLSATFQNDLSPARTATVEVPNYSQLLSVEYDNYSIRGFFAFDSETPPDDCVQRTFYVTPGDGNVPDGNYQHCGSVKFEHRPVLRLHVFELVQSSGS